MLRLFYKIPTHQFHCFLPIYYSSSKYFKEKSHQTDKGFCNLPPLNPNPALDDLNSFQLIKKQLLTKEFNFQNIYLRANHLNLVHLCSELVNKTDFHNQLEIKNLLEIFKRINKNLHYLLLPTNEPENNSDKINLMTDLIKLQEFIGKILSEIPQDYCFYLNIHFLKVILHEKNELWTHKMLETLQKDLKLQEFFLNLLEVLKFNEMGYLLQKVAKKNKEMVSFFKNLKDRIFSQKTLNEIDNLNDYHYFFVLSQQFSQDLKITNENLITKFFELLKVFDNDWALSIRDVNSIMFHLKKICIDIESKSFILSNLKEIANCSSVWGLDHLISFLRILKGFTKFFSLQNTQDNHLYLDFVQEFFLKNLKLFNFQASCMIFEILKEKSYEIKSLVDFFTMDHMMEYVIQTPDIELSSFLESLFLLSRNNIYAKVFSNPPKNLIKTYGLKTNKAIILCYHMNPRDCHLYNFNIEELNQYKDNQFYLTKCLSFINYISMPLFNEFVECSLQRVEKIMDTGNFIDFLESFLSFIRSSDRVVEYFKNQSPKRILLIQSRINLELKENPNILTSTLMKIVITTTNSDIKLSEKHLIKYIKQNIYHFIDSEVSILAMNLGISRQLFPELLELFQIYYLKRLDNLNSKDYLNIMKAIGGFNNYQFNHHFLQGFYEVMLSRATFPEYSPMIIEYIYNQAKYEKKKQYGLQTPINNLIFALKKSTYYMTLYKFSKVLKAFSRIKTNFKQTLESDFKSFFKDEKLLNEIPQIPTRQLAFIYTAIFSYAFTDEGGFEILKRLQEVITLELSQNLLRNFDIGRIISEITINYLLIKDIPEFTNFLIKELLPRTLNEDFFFIETSKTQKDIGLFSLVFWSLSLLQIPKFTENFIKIFQKDIDTLIKLSITFQEKSLHSLNNPQFAKENTPPRQADLKNNLKNIHLMQIYQALTFISCYLKGENTEESKFIDKKLDFIKKVESMNKPVSKEKSFDESKRIDNNLQEKVYSVIKDEVFQGTNQPIILEKQFGVFYADIFVEEPYNIIIECNGSQHYKGGKLKLNDIRKYEVFKNLHQKKVLEINYIEWGIMKRNEQISFLKKSLGIVEN